MMFGGEQGAAASKPSGGAGVAGDEGLELPTLPTKADVSTFISGALPCAGGGGVSLPSAPFWSPFTLRLAAVPLQFCRTNSARRGRTWASPWPCPAASPPPLAPSRQQRSAPQPLPVQ